MNRIKLSNLLRIIDDSCNLRFFIDDEYLCDINPVNATNLLKDYFKYEVENIDISCLRIEGGGTIVTMCIYLIEVEE